jgi:HlyD family secretion protein
MTDTNLIRQHPRKFAAGLLALALLAILAVRWWRGPELAVDTVMRRDFVQSVVASGHVEAPHRVDIGAQITGTVLRVPVRDGQSVEVGDLLVELESAELRAVQRQAEVGVVQAQAHRRQVREVQTPVAEQALRQAQANLATARSTRQRNEDLFRKGFISQAALDQVRNLVELADAQLRTAQTQLDAAQPAGTDALLADAAVAQAIAGSDAARARAAYTGIRAPVAGTLIGRNVEAGDVVQPGRLLMTLSPAGRTQLVVAIDEKNLHLLALGQKAVVSADAYPQQRFAAEVAYINPGVNALTGSVDVKLAVSAPPAVLSQDMTVSIDIEVARHPAVLLLATGAVHDADGPSPWVLRVEGGAATRRPIRLGLRSAGFVEVVEGLQSGDRVIPVAAALAAGDRLRIMAPVP